MAQDHFERHNRREGAKDWNFNVIFEDEPTVADMAAGYAPLLTGPEFYTPIPPQWIHATILRVGSIDEYTETEMRAVADMIENRLHNIKLPRFELGAPIQIFGNVCCSIKPESELEKLYDVVTTSLEKVVGPKRATKSPYGRFIAHTSFVYTKTRSNEAETEASLSEAVVAPAQFRISHMPLILQWPTKGHYEWDVVQDITVY